MKHKEDYVSFEQAVKLKEMGFDWLTIHYYDVKTYEFSPKISHNYTVCYDNWNEYSNSISSPTLAQTAKWLREVKSIIICIEPRFHGSKRPLVVDYEYHLFNKDDGCYIYIEAKTIYDTYEKSLSAGINKALELLKEENK